MNCLRSLEHWDLGFDFHSRHGCLCEFILCLCCSVCIKRPCDRLIPRPRRPTESLTIMKLSETKRFTDALSSKEGTKEVGVGRRERITIIKIVLKILQVDSDIFVTAFYQFTAPADVTLCRINTAR
jgi:hypothetical protein